MDFFRKYFCILLMSFLIARGQSAPTIEIINENVTKVSQDENYYYLLMDENNHEYVQNDDLVIPLIQVVGIDSSDIPILVPITTMFSNSFHAVDGDTTAYQLDTLQVFDYENMPSNMKYYTFSIRNSNINPPIIVRIDINNIDDEAPTFSPPICTVDESTIYTKETSTCTGTVQDPDGWLGYMVFDFDESLYDQFGLEYREFPDNKTITAPVYLTVLKPLDYQLSPFHSFNINAQDSAGHLNTLNVVTAYIKVNDLRNNPPTWTRNLPYETFPEKTEQTFYVEAKDGDKGINDPVYYVVDYDPYDFITIDKDTGVIQVSKIDRDKYDLTIYQFTLMAYVDPIDLWNVTMEVNFYVQDVDDNPPVIKWVTINDTNTTEFPADDVDKRIFLTFIENYNGNLNTTTFIEDIDQAQNSEFSVTLEDEDGAAASFTEAFMISPTTGLRNGTFQMSVRDSTNLDFENSTWKEFSYYVYIEGTLDPSHTDKMLVTIQLIDYNDEWPKFENEALYEFSINETAKEGDVIGTVSATDRDAEDQGKLKYELISTQDTVDVDSSSGELTVAKENAFDYDKINPVFLQVKVTDTADHSATVPVTIKLQDVNNKAPTITFNNVVNVDENQQEGAVLNVTITASDVDTTASLVATIDWAKSSVTKNSRQLDLDNDTIAQLVEFVDVSYDPEDSGHITIELVVNGNNPTGTSPDYETFDSLYLSLKVTDLNTDPEFKENESTSVTVLITINDLNDNTPYFPENGNSEPINRTVIENARLGTSVGTITAIDADQIDEGKIVYSCIASGYDWLDVDSKTGALTVKADSLVNADIPLWYFNYSCTAVDSDPDHISEPLEVSIYIIDTNNKEPSTTLPNEVRVEEKTSNNTPIHEIEIHDDDRDPPFNTAVCSLLDIDSNSKCPQKFKIVNNVIEVAVANGETELDRDYGDKNYSCSGTCKDNIHMELGDTTQHTLAVEFVIVLIDINDHAPELDMDTDLLVYENVEKDQDTNVKIIAKDPDEAENGTIIFDDWIVTSEQGIDMTELFAIVIDEEDYRINDIQKQAHLVAKEDLKDHYGKYTIEIKMQDNATVPQTNNQSISLEIKKYNFEPPRFVFPTDGQNFILNSDQNANSKLIQFWGDVDLPDFSVADNSDTDSCTKWTVDMTIADQEQIPSELDIATEERFFKIEPLEDCNFQLQVDDTFVDNQKSYSVVLKAIFKNDRVPFEDEAAYDSNITITIDFRNKTQEPIFKNQTWQISFLEEDSSLTYPIGDMKAVYEPSQPDSVPIYYTLVTSDTDTEAVFDIDPTTGTIKLKDKLDYETRKEYTFVIVASNSKNKVSDDPQSRMNVRVEVIDINDHPPVFDFKLYYGAIMPTFTSGMIVVTAQATDEDEIDKDKLTYYLDSDFTIVGEGFQNLPTPFTVNQNGQINLNFAVDSSMAGYIYFTIRVQDIEDDWKNGPFNDTATVYIFIVTTDNVVTFLFQNSRNDVLDQEKRMLEIVGENIRNYTAGRQDIVEVDGYSTNAKLFFIDHGYNSDDEDFLYYSNSETLSLVKATDVLKVVTSFDTYSKLKQTLRNETGLILESFPSPNNTENLEPVLKAWLIGVSVVLGTLCVVLLIIFMLKIRQLNRTISNLVSKKYGSQESGLNRLGVSLPTANKHAVEGSNPVYSINRDEKEKDLFDYDDQKSVNSGDSELIGVEENPEFDYNYNDEKNNNTITSM